MVDDYFENDPHERVKVTLQLLNERFFDEEKFLGDAYQLPKFPIENSLRNYQLILVGFKAGRIDVFYLPTNNPTNPELLNLKVGDLVIVEADRGRDLGKVFKMNISIDEARLLKLLQFQEQQAALNEHVDNILDDISVKSLSDQQQQQAQQQQQGAGTAGSSGGGSSSTTAPPTLHFPKSVIALAQPNEIIQILNKKQDEEKACRLCLAKIANATSGSLLGGPTSPATQDLLQMKLIDAEYQFDRKKLIFYYSTSRRIDFRDLVRELFRIYKTRIWMCAVIGLPYQISSRRNSNSPLLGAPPQPTLTTTTSTTGSATSGSSFINPFMQQQQQPSATTASSTTSIPTTSNSQYNINRLDRRLSFQIPPTYQQQGQAQQQTINYPQQQQGQQGQIPLSYQLDFIPRRFSDSRSQISSTWQQQQPSQQQQYVIPTKYQFPPSQQQGHHHQTTGSISEILQPHSEEHSPGRIMNDENEQDRDGCEEFKDDEIMKQEDKDVDDIEVDEESFSNHSGESFVLKSLVDSINH
jgi:cell fate regulator YaaT (PSP1 superfamily)